MGRRGPKPGSAKKKGSGRKAGTPNKRSTDLIERAQEIGFDPLDKAIQIINSRSITPAAKVAACLKLAEFMYPKRKPTDAPLGKDEVKAVVTYKTEWGNRKEASDAGDDD